MSTDSSYTKEKGDDIKLYKQNCSFMARISLALAAVLLTALKTTGQVPPVWDSLAKPEVRGRSLF